MVGSVPSLHVAGGGFEWDDDFPLMPVKPSLMASLTGTPAEPDPAVPALVPVQKQVLPIQFSRFTVSPAPVSRFSITHVSDSDMDSIGGESQDPPPPPGVWRAAVARFQPRWEPGVCGTLCPHPPWGRSRPPKGWVSHGNTGTHSCRLSARCRQQRRRRPGVSQPGTLVGHCPGTGAGRQRTAGPGAGVQPWAPRLRSGFFF